MFSGVDTEASDSLVFFWIHFRNSFAAFSDCFVAAAAAFAQLISVVPLPLAQRTSAACAVFEVGCSLDHRSTRVTEIEVGTAESGVAGSSACAASLEYRFALLLLE